MGLYEKGKVETGYQELQELHQVWPNISPKNISQPCELTHQSLNKTSVELPDFRHQQFLHMGGSPYIAGKCHLMRMLFVSFQSLRI